MYQGTLTLTTHSRQIQTCQCFWPSFFDAPILATWLDRIGLLRSQETATFDVSKSIFYAACFLTWTSYRPGAISIIQRLDSQLTFFFASVKNKCWEPAVRVCEMCHLRLFSFVCFFVFLWVFLGGGGWGKENIEQ